MPRSCSVRSCRVEDPRFVRAGWLRVAVLRALRRLDIVVRHYPLHAILLALPVGLLMLAGFLANLLTRSSRTLPDDTMISSVSLVLRPARDWARRAALRARSGELVGEGKAERLLSQRDGGSVRKGFA